MDSLRTFLFGGIMKRVRVKQLFREKESFSEKEVVI